MPHTAPPTGYRLYFLKAMNAIGFTCCTQIHARLYFPAFMIFFMQTHTHTHLYGFSYPTSVVGHLLYITFTFCGHKVNWVNMKLRIK